MKADTIDLNHLFFAGVRYEVPMFQRPYVWTEVEHWEPLWEDISTTAERLLQERVRATPEEREQGTPERATPPHFLGAVVLDQMLSPPGEIERRNIVDGQQRLMTLQLLMAAVHEIAADLGSEEVHRLSKLMENDEILWRAADDRFKVWPTNADRAAFRLAMCQIPPAPEAEVSSRILEAHTFFKNEVAEWISGDEFASQSERLSALRVVLWGHVKLVSINLEREDDAQIIFESLNARGTPLLAADLVKNFVFQKAVRQNANIDGLYTRYWRSLDEQYWRTTIRQGRLQRPRLDVFFYHWLTMRSGHDVLVSRLFESFKEAVPRDEPAEKTLEEVDLFARVFRSFEEFPPNSQEEVFFYRLDATQTTTATPLLLFLFSLTESQLVVEERRAALDAIESWLVRRMICRLTTKNYNIVFAQLLAEVRKDPQHAGQVTQSFLSRQRGESQAWPTDEEVRRATLSVPYYRVLSKGRLRMALEAIEARMRVGGYAEEPAPARNLSIEHIMPQSWHAHWKELPVGVDPQVAAIDRDHLVHTLGNLTLVTSKLNSAQSNAHWSKKRGTLAEHTVLMLNKNLLSANPNSWGEASIRQRGEELADQIVDIWKAPSRSESRQLVEAPTSVEPSISAPVASEQSLGRAIRADVQAFLGARVPDEDRRRLLESLITEILRLEDVSASVSRSPQTKDGWAYSVNVRRKGFKPVFVHVYANGTVLFRLTPADAIDVDSVTLTKKTGHPNYGVRCALRNDEDHEICLELAKRAYAKAVG